MTAPMGAHGFSAQDLSCVYSIASESDSRLAPFRVPSGLPESDAVARTFNEFKSIYGIYTRITREKSLADITACNRDRVVRWFE